MFLCNSCSLLRHWANLPPTSLSYLSLITKICLEKSMIKLLYHKREMTVGTSTSLRVLFFGNDEFSAESLRTLYYDMKNERSLISTLDVVTSAKSKANPVRKFAMEQQLRIHDWPPRIYVGDYDVGLVVSFGHLIPEKIIKLFKFGMLNVHASLLPRWRGAAPIIYTILNGDTESGVTIMQIAPKKFDVGNILSQSSCQVLDDETTLQLSSRLASLGGDLLLQCVRNLPDSLQMSRKQPDTGVTYAPRVTSDLARVKWQEMNASVIFNLSRALAGLYPLSTIWHGIPVKLYNATLITTQLHVLPKPSEPGTVEFHRESNLLRVSCHGSQWIGFSGVGVAGKKPMKPIDFYNGYISKHTSTERRFS